MKVLAISGSIRTQSYNSAAIRAAKALAPEGMEMEIFSLAGIPFMNQDLEGDNLPESVQTLIDKARWADAILFSTPEYNNMIPGMTKNAFEWLSRSYAVDAVKGKPLFIMGASDGGFGTARAQFQMLTLGAILGMRVDGAWRLPISMAQDKFDAEGNLHDEDTKAKIANLLAKIPS